MNAIQYVQSRGDEFAPIELVPDNNSIPVVAKVAISVFPERWDRPPRDIAHPFGSLCAIISANADERLTAMNLHRKDDDFVCHREYVDSQFPEDFRDEAFYNYDDIFDKSDDPEGMSTNIRALSNETLGQPLMALADLIDEFSNDAPPEQIESHDQEVDDLDEIGMDECEAGKSEGVDLSYSEASDLNHTPIPLRHRQDFCSSQASNGELARALLLNIFQAACLNDSFGHRVQLSH